MTLEHDHFTAHLGEEVEQAGFQVTELIGDLATLATRMVAIKDIVTANVGGIFDNPTDLDFVNTSLIAMRDEIQAFANGL